MSAVGHCGDNAACESFFVLLKRYRVHRHRHYIRDAAQADMFGYVERPYSPACCVELLAKIKSF